jgi:hypothetical protein
MAPGRSPTAAMPRSPSPTCTSACGSPPSRRAISTHCRSCLRAPRRPRLSCRPSPRSLRPPRRLSASLPRRPLQTRSPPRGSSPRRWHSPRRPYRLRRPRRLHSLRRLRCRRRCRMHRRRHRLMSRYAMRWRRTCGPCRRPRWAPSPPRRRSHCAAKHGGSRPSLSAPLRPQDLRPIPLGGPQHQSRNAPSPGAALLVARLVPFAPSSARLPTPAGAPPRRKPLAAPRPAVRTARPRRRRARPWAGTALMEPACRRRCLPWPRCSLPPRSRER